MPVVMRLDDVGYNLPVGHRLRLSVSSAYWPLIWPTPEPVTLTVLADDARLSVPVSSGIAVDSSEDLFEPPEAALAQRLRGVREGGHSRNLEFDQTSGAATLHIVDDFGEAEDLDTGLITSECARETQSIHPDDPLCASMSCHWTQTLQRDTWKVRTEARVKMHSDQNAFYIEAVVDAYEGDEHLHSKVWTETVARDNI